MSLLDSILSVASGGVTGLVGAGIQSFVAFKTKELELKDKAADREHEVAMVKANAEVMQMEWAAKTQVASIEAQGAVDAEDAKAFAASYDLEPKRYAEGLTAAGWEAGLMFLLDFLRGFVRPAMTFYLCAITTIVYFQARAILNDHGATLTVDQALETYNRIIETILYLSVTVTLWWFGTRVKK